MRKRLGIGIVTFERRAQVLDTIEQVKALTRGAFDVVVADDGSSDGTAEAVRAAGVACVSGPNRGVAWNKNRALFYLVHVCKCDSIILLEDDTVPAVAGWQKSWVEGAQRWGHVSLFAPMHRRFVRSGSGTLHDPALLGGVTAQCAAFSREALCHVGFMDTRFGKFGYEHCEHSFRMVRAGYGGVLHEDEALLYALTSNLVLMANESHASGADIVRNHEVLKAVRAEPVFRQAWRSDAEMEQFRDEMASAHGGTRAVPPAPPVPPPRERPTVDSNPENYLGYVDVRSTRHVAGWVLNLARIGHRVVCEVVLPRLDGTGVSACWRVGWRIGPGHSRIWE